MSSPALAEIESRLPMLSRDEQLRLIERLAKGLQDGNQARSESLARFERSVEAMAGDPQIQAEIKAISEEFAGSEMDGLEDH